MAFVFAFRFLDYVIICISSITMYIPGQHKNCFNDVTIPLIFFMYKLRITLKIVAENTIENLLMISMHL